MSFLEVEPSTHDLFVSLGINMLQQEHGCILVRADGGLPFLSHQTSSPPILLGYKPDAIMGNGASYFLLEAKDFSDLTSGHSITQFKAAHFVLETMPLWHMLLLVFNAPSSSPLWPDTLSYLHPHPRVTLRAFEEGGAQ